MAKKKTTSKSKTTEAPAKVEKKTEKKVENWFGTPKEERIK